MTHEELLGLVRLYADQFKSASQIGAILGKTEQSVRGLCKRNKIALKGNSKPLPNKNSIGVRTPVARKAIRPKPRPGQNYFALSGPCRWPDGGCSSPRINNRPYCSDHCAKAYRYTPLLTEGVENNG